MNGFCFGLCYIRAEVNVKRTKCAGKMWHVFSGVVELSCPRARLILHIDRGSWSHNLKAMYRCAHNKPGCSGSAIDDKWVLLGYCDLLFIIWLGKVLWGKSPKKSVRKNSIIWSENFSSGARTRSSLKITCLFLSSCLLVFLFFFVFGLLWAKVFSIFCQVSGSQSHTD